MKIKTPADFQPGRQERVIGFEPTISCLGSKRSTTELHPQVFPEVRRGDYTTIVQREECLKSIMVFLVIQNYRFQKMLVGCGHSPAQLLFQHFLVYKNGQLYSQPAYR
jgi:hypothetical protein